MKEKKQKIINLLKKNGFEREDTNHYISEYSSVVFEDEEIIMADGEGYTVSSAMDYYAMIGLLYSRQILEPIKL